MHNNTISEVFVQKVGHNTYASVCGVFYNYNTYIIEHYNEVCGWLAGVGSGG